MLKRTTLFSQHQRLGARLVDFGGWEMPVQYSGILDEHQCVRRHAGLFDIAHMGQVAVSGPKAEPFLQALLTNDVGRLQIGQGQYTLMCLPDGGVVDDLYLYRLEQDHYWLVINASRVEPDLVWMRGRQQESNWGDGVTVRDESGTWGAVAIQGPRCREVLERALGRWNGERIVELSKNRIATGTFDGHPLRVACTGYTGEDGFEVMAPHAALPVLWENFLAQGTDAGIKPCGLGARDSLRLEACYPLYGHELSETISPVEAGLGFFVAWEKGSFTGVEALRAQKAEGAPRKIIAIKMVAGSAPPRGGYKVWSTGPASRPIGELTSGGVSPTLGTGIGLALVERASVEIGGPVGVEIRGKRYGAEVVKKPFYRKPV